MKLFDTDKIHPSSTDEDYQIVTKAILYYQNKIDTKIEWKITDANFEYDNQCTLLYDRDRKIRFIMFEDDAWFWFKAKWL